MNYRKILYYLLTLSIILLSFFLYSSRFYPLLHSDDALSVLMAHYYHLPNDFYCWGQDRGGTLIPLISQVFIKLFNCSALLAVSLSNYFILIIGFIGFSSLIKSKYYKLVFAIIWFLPFQRFIDLLRFPIGVEYSLLGLLIFLICKLENHNLKQFTKHLLFILIVLVFTISVWVSDLAIVSISVLLFTLFVFHFTKNKTIKIDKIVLYYISIAAVFCFLFIKFAKSFAVIKRGNYLAINGFDEIGKALLLIKETLWESLTFNINEPVISIYICLAILFILSFIFIVLKRKLFRYLISNKWIFFFAAEFVVIFTVLLLSSRVLANEMGRRYFVATYISVSMLIILALDNMALNHKMKLLRYGILLLAVIGAISPIYMMKYHYPKSLKPQVDIVKEFKQLGEIGIIAEYWNSYITSCPDPEMIKATPNESSEVRNLKIVDMVFERKNIYVIRDYWLEAFPDTLEQFGYVLLKDGNQFRIGGCDVCKYHKTKVSKSFRLQNLKLLDSLSILDSLGVEKALFVPKNCNSCREKVIVSGPFIPIGIGEFTASFKIKANGFKNNSPIALLDIVADNGDVKFAEKTINKHYFPTDDYYYIDLDFKTLRIYSNVEFRIYYYGNANLYFEEILLKEK